MAKRKKNQEQLPEGMSRRQAKLAARAAERAALARDPRPYGNLPFEADLIALQEFVPSATVKVAVPGAERDVYLCTVLPGGGAVLVRDDGAYVALQTRNQSYNPHRDLARALEWAITAQPGEELESAVAENVEPKLDKLIPAMAPEDIKVFDDFTWWIPAGTEVNPQYAQAIKAANDSVMPSRRITTDIAGAAWWIDTGDKAHIRWVRTENEDKVVRALARIAARGELKLGEETKFAGVFRTHGIAVPVWDLDPDRDYTNYAAELKRVDKAILAELDNDAQLSSEERRQLENIKSRQVTI